MDTVLSDSGRVAKISSEKVLGDRDGPLWSDVVRSFRNDIKAENPPQQLISYIDSIGQRLWSASELPLPKHKNIVVTGCQLFRDESVSGIYVVLCTPTLDALSNESELGFLMAHETCHVILHHSVDDDKLHEISSDARWWSKAITGPLGDIWIDIASHNAMSAHVRLQEHEADLCAVDLMERAHFNLNGAIGFLDLVEQWSVQENKLMEERKNTDTHPYALDKDLNAIFGRYQTHDETTKRIEIIKEYIKSVYPFENRPSSGVLSWLDSDSSSATTVREYIRKFPVIEYNQFHYRVILIEPDPK